MESVEKNNLVIPEDDLKLIHPFRFIISGPSGSGKSEFVFKLMKNATSITQPPITQIIYIYGEWQKRFEDFKDIEFFTSDLNYLNFNPKNGDGDNILIIVDDLMNELSKSKDLLNLFTRGSHHKGVSVILILQNIFQKGEIFKTLRDNSTYFGITEHLCDQEKIAIFARQLEGCKRSRYFMESYKDCVSVPYRVFFIDNHPIQK